MKRILENTNAVANMVNEPRDNYNYWLNKVIRLTSCLAMYDGCSASISFANLSSGQHPYIQVFLHSKYDIVFNDSIMLSILYDRESRANVFKRLKKSVDELIAFTLSQETNN